MMEVVLFLSTLSSSPIVPQLSKEMLEEMDRLLATSFSTVSPGPEVGVYDHIGDTADVGGVGLVASVFFCKRCPEWGETCFSQAGLGRPLCLLARGVPWGGIEVHFTILGSDGLGSLILTLFDHLMDLFESFSQAF